MPAPEMTEEKKNDLLAIQMRGGLYADKFFKKGSDTKGLPKYFQVSFIKLEKFILLINLFRRVLLLIIQLISTDVFRRKIERKQFSKNSIVILKLKSMSFFYTNLNIKLYCLCLRFSKKRYGEIKATNRRRIAASKHMKRLKTKKK